MSKLQYRIASRNSRGRSRRCRVTSVAGGGAVTVVITSLRGLVRQFSQPSFCLDENVIARWQPPPPYRRRPWRRRWYIGSRSSSKRGIPLACAIAYWNRFFQPVACYVRRVPAAAGASPEPAAASLQFSNGETP